MERERLDLTPLDPSGDPAFMDRMVARIMAAARPELERRAGLGDVIYFLGRWSRPALAAAATLAVIAGSVLARGELAGAGARMLESSPYITADMASEEDVSVWEKLVLPPSHAEDLYAVMDGEWQ